MFGDYFHSHFLAESEVVGFDHVAKRTPADEAQEKIAAVFDSAVELGWRLNLALLCLLGVTHLGDVLVHVAQEQGGST